MENTSAMKDILEIVQFIKDNAASKQDLLGLATKTDLAQLDGTVKLLKSDFEEFKDDVLTTLDKHSVILQRLDQERTFTLERVKNLEEDVKQIKLKLAIA